MALVSTPDAAKDLFKGLWDQREDKELYQAYSNLDTFSTSDSYIPASTCAQEAGIGYRTRAAVAAQQHRSARTTATANKKRELSPATLKQLRLPDPTTRISSSSHQSPISTDGSSNCSDPPTSATTSAAAAAASTALSPPSDAVTSTTDMNHPYYPTHIGGNSPGNTALANRYTQLALLLVSQSQNQLSREEEEKRRVRRERNKVAATKCREKRKAHSVFVRHEYSQVSDTTKRLEEQISSLKRERDELLRLLDNHQCHIRQSEHHHDQQLMPDMFIKPEPRF